MNIPFDWNFVSEKKIFTHDPQNKKFLFLYSKALESQLEIILQVWAKYF